MCNFNLSGLTLFVLEFIQFIFRFLLLVSVWNYNECMQIQYLPGHGGGEEGSEYRIEIK